MIKRLSFGAVHEAFENYGAVAYPGQGTGRDREVIANEIELRDSNLRREVQLVRMRDLDFAPVDGETFACFLRHNDRLAFRPPAGATPDALRNKEE